jgi:hypothetical protein
VGRPPKARAARDALTTIQVSTTTRDRLYALKFRHTYDEFLVLLCDLYEKARPDQRSEAK